MKSQIVTRARKGTKFRQINNEERNSTGEEKDYSQKVWRNALQRSETIHELMAVVEINGKIFRNLFWSF